MSRRGFLRWLGTVPAAPLAVMTAGPKFPVPIVAATPVRQFVPLQYFAKLPRNAADFLWRRLTEVDKDMRLGMFSGRGR